MKIGIFLVCLWFSNFCFSTEFDNAIGFGVQYGGLIGWQGSVSDENFHGRIAIGLVGLTVGGDVNINDYISLGATTGSIAVASVNSLNINYYPSGKYTEGWRLCLDVGTAKTHVYGEDSGSFTAISIGYSFR
jgi:hypothetical protein